MNEREDWFADSEGNLTPPGEEPPQRELKPDTDEFGRDDPAALERERRRREREARRKGRPAPAREKAPKKRGGGRRAERGGLLGGLRRRREPPSEEMPQTEGRAPASPPRDRPAAEPRQAPPPAAEGKPPVADETPPSSSGFGRRRAIAIVGAVLGILLLWFLVALFQPFAGDGLGEGRVAVEIPEEASASEVADLLADKGVVSNGTLFQLRLRLSGKSGELVSGPIAMAEGMSYSAAIDRLTGETSEAGKLLMPEALSIEEDAEAVAGAGITGDYVEAAMGSKGFDPTKYGAPKDVPSLEGFLYPATYDLFEGETADDLVAEQLVYFQQNFKSVDLTYAKKKNLTPYDVLIIASMIDREVQEPKERPLVAAVIYNRLSKGEPLGIDATTRYEYNEWEKAITQDQLDKDTPYNTRLNVGLPPTPIGNPRLEAIEAAANPAKVDYLFYVVKPGTCPAQHAFTNSEAEFDKLVAEYNAARADAGNESPTC